MPEMRLRPGGAPGRGSAPDPDGGAYSAPPDPLARVKGPTSKGRGGQVRDGREGKGRKGRGRVVGREGGGNRREGKGGREV